jgi:hypothetical protein
MTPTVKDNVFVIMLLRLYGVVYGLSMFKKMLGCSPWHHCVVSDAWAANN